MAYVVTGRPALTIPSGGSTSNVAADFDAVAITIYSPATVTASQIIVEVEPSSSGTSFVTLQSGGSDVVLVAGKATIIAPPTFKQLRLTSTSVEGQDDVFPMTQTIAV